ncbi:MAG: Ig-like domain-containing protein, partial [Cyclobacteriaceae bacterium]
MRKFVHQGLSEKISENEGRKDLKGIISFVFSEKLLSPSWLFYLLILFFPLISQQAVAQCGTDHDTADQTVANHASVGSSFQAGCDGILSSISLTFTGNSGDDGIINTASLTVYSGDPDVGTIQGQLTNLTILTTGEQTFDLESLGILLVNGNNYSFLLDNEGDADQFNYEFETTSNYADGSLWFDPDGATLTNTVTSDLEFSFEIVAPVTYNTVWLDDDSDGNIDQLRLDFSENVDFIDVNGSGDTFDAITVAGVTLTNTIDFGTVTDVSSFTFDVTGVSGTLAPTTDVIYSPGTNNTIISNVGSTEILDLTTAVTNSDQVAPEFQSAVAVSPTLVQLQYSEAVSVNFATPADWSATGLTVSNAAVNIGDNTIIELTVDPIGPGYSATDLVLSINDDPSDQITDVYSNLAADLASEAIADGQTPDLIGNGVLSFEPDDQADFTGTVDATTTDLDIIFNENVQAGSGNIQLFLDSDNDGVAESTIFDLASSNPAIAYIAESATTDKVRIDLSALGLSLSGLVTYFVNVESGAIADLAGNDYSGFTDATTWNFTTLSEAVAPTVLSFTPSDNAANVAIDADFTIIFNEPVTAGTTEEIQLRLASNDLLVETVQASSLNITNNEATIDFVSDLSGFNDFYITAESGIVEDLSGNVFAGFSSKTVWNFKTESGTDVIAPTVTQLSPADGATNITT